jgi:hypothetical protein
VRVACGCVCVCVREREREGGGLDGDEASCCKLSPLLLKCTRVDRLWDTGKMKPNVVVHIFQRENFETEFNEIT